MKDHNNKKWKIEGLLPEPVRERLRDNPLLRRVLGNTSWLVFERVVSLAIRFFVGVWLVRYLGPESYGVYSYALSLIGLFVALATLGLDNVVIRNLTRDQVEEGELLSTALALRLTSGVATAIAIAAVSILSHDDSVRQFVVIVMSTHLIFKSADVFDFWFQSEIKSKYAVWVRSGVTVTYAGGQVACILLGLGVEAFAFLYISQSLLRALGTWGAYMKVSARSGTWKIRLSTAKRMMSDAWPLIIASLSIAIYMRIDQVMIGIMMEDKEVGIYATAAKISELWYFLPTAIVGSLYPKIVDLRDNAREEEYRFRMQQIYDFMAGMGYLIVVPIVLVADPMMRILFGDDFAASAGILQIHMWSFLFVAFGVVRERWLVAENYTRFSMAAAILGAVVNVSLNYVLIPQTGGVGAAWATLWAQIASVFLICVMWKPLRHVSVQMMKAIALPLRLHKVTSK